MKKGKRKLKRNISFYTGIANYNFNAGTEFEIGQCASNGKSIVDFGDRIIDWKANTWIERNSESM